MSRDIHRSLVKDPALRAVCLAAIKAGMRYRLTAKGIMFYGENGMTATTHFTQSDHRALKNFTQKMKQCGFVYEPAKATKRKAGK